MSLEVQILILQEQKKEKEKTLVDWLKFKSTLFSNWSIQFSWA
jgi:hypothetical protein